MLRDELNKLNIHSEILVEGSKGKAFEVPKGKNVTIIDAEGQQVVDFLAFTGSEFKEYFSVSHTRYSIGKHSVQKGDKLVTNFQNPIFEIVEDTVGAHDMSFPMCDHVHLAKEGVTDNNHRTCRQNFTEVLQPYGIENWRLPDPLNLFQNTPDLQITDDSISKPGDYVTLRCLEDVLIAISACPYDLDGFNGGKPTSIKVLIHD